jgi:hypothetical protein
MDLPHSYWRVEMGKGYWFREKRPEKNISRTWIGEIVGRGWRKESVLGLVLGHGVVEHF